MNWLESYSPPYIPSIKTNQNMTLYTVHRNHPSCDTTKLQIDFPFSRVISTTIRRMTATIKMKASVCDIPNSLVNPTVQKPVNIFRIAPHALKKLEEAKNIHAISTRTKVHKHFRILVLMLLLTVIFLFSSHFLLIFQITR